MSDGQIITVSDFDEIAEPKTISKSLERIMKNGHVEKIFSGIFWKPSKTCSLDPIQLANAFARKNKWSIAPCGETALHLMGLAKNHSNKWTFVTNDKNVEYNFNDVCITFKHTSRKFLEGMSDNTRLFVQAIKAYGRDKSLEPLNEKARTFGAHERHLIALESSNVTKWISDYIKRIMGEKENTNEHLSK